MASTPNSNKSEKPTLASNPYNPASAAYLAYPVKHVVSSLYRRMTEPPDQPVSRLLDAPVVSKANSLPRSPDRRPSPFQPPPLSPLSLEHKLSEASAEDLLLTRSLAEEIRLLIPPRLQLLTSWRLAYSLAAHGSSLATLYDHCEKVTGALGATQRGGYILVIRDGSNSADSGSVFGAFLTDAPKPSTHYYGTGECFLWRASILPSLHTLSAVASPVNGGRGEPPTEDLLELAGLPPPPSADTTNAQRTTTVRGERRASSVSSKSKANSPTTTTATKQLPSISSNKFSPTLLSPRDVSPAPSGTSTPDRIRFKAFPYSGINDFMIYCQSSYLSVGGGDGHYGLWLDDQLDNGISESCPTFGNEPLSDEDSGGHKGRFEVVGVEIWYVGA